MSETTITITFNTAPNGNMYYVYDDVNYDVHFPVHWAFDHQVFDDCPSGPEDCGNCALYGSYRGVFVGYCCNCLRHYQEFGLTRGDYTVAPGIDINDNCFGSNSLWQKYPYMNGVEWTQIGHEDLTFQALEDAKKIAEEDDEEEQEKKEEEDKLQLLQSKIEELEKTVKFQKTCIDSTSMTVYQLLGGLYHQRDQGDILNNQIALLHSSDPFNNPRLQKKCNDPSKWGIWPTTRQGDDNEKRIDKLEKLVATLL
ncbi:MAG: hypothetical protein RLZ10_690 [Bacteroidota bacterium]|jgi:uncharacterized coiled-coil protein SlyX